MRKSLQTIYHNILSDNAGCVAVALKGNRSDKTGVKPKFEVKI